MATKHFFDTVRPLFRGLTQGQVDGMNKIVAYGEEWGYSNLHLAYILATIKHETANWMQPIREGARRYGLAYSDASAKRAVSALHGKGLISRNYALPTGPFNQSYYGRGLVQITLIDNYRKFEKLLNKPLLANPDLALDWDTSLDITFLGMRDGMFRRDDAGPIDLARIKDAGDFKAARNMINGDSHKTWGGKERMDDKCARYAKVFLKGLTDG